jgi:hypothetical protein
MKKYYIYENNEHPTALYNLLDDILACSSDEALSTAVKLWPGKNIFISEELL